MQERIAQIPTPDGAMGTFIAHPDEGGPFPAVVLFMDIWGVREELHDIARNVATVGYCCLVPDSYYRQGSVRFAVRDESNRMMSLHLLDQEVQQSIFAARRKLSIAMVMSDMAALLDYVDDDPAVRPGPVGSFGYCLGGLHALAAAGHFPDRFQANASMHGTYLISDATDSPHLLVDEFRGELYCGFGERDPYSPADLIEELGRLLDRAEVRHRIVVHPGAEHGYALPDRDIHDKQATARDWEHIFSMFRRVIPPPVG